jgi:hypothetical protein
MKQSGRLIAYAALGVIALLLVWNLREGFGGDEFYDESAYKKTLDSELSSYAQVTNHFQPTPSESADILSGVPTTHRVNQYFGRR